MLEAACRPHARTPFPWVTGCPLFSREIRRETPTVVPGMASLAYQPCRAWNGSDFLGISRVGVRRDGSRQMKGAWRDPCVFMGGRESFWPKL